MLSRLAEAFYWIGRYLERAEATARLLAEHYHLTVEDRSVPEDVAAAVVLDALSLPHDVISSPTELVRALLGDVANPSTVIGAVGAARENARSVRDALPGDVFEALNGAHLTLTRGLTAAASPGASMFRVLERLMIVNGAIEWTMTRDEGHYFLSLGRALERVDMTARLLDVRHDLVWPDTGPVATLRSAAALSAFLRTGETLTGDTVREFLVLDPTFPRTLLHSARAAEEAVRGLQVQGGVDDAALVREVGLMRARLEFAGGTHDPSVIDQLCHDTQVSGVATAAAVADSYFRQAGTIVWSH
ncbi:MAG: hypothetical protein GC157_03665 [Frankiales bacterium]|nr:hypothetical protein [Frankiales bacterium]